MPALTPEQEALKQAALAATPGPWEVDTIRNDGAYGSGDDTHTGFTSYVVIDANGDALFDTLNYDNSSVTVDNDEDGAYAFDEPARNDADFVALANPTAILALFAQLEAAPSEPYGYMVQSEDFDFPESHQFIYATVYNSAPHRYTVVQKLFAEPVASQPGSADATELAEWRRLKDPAVLHASLLLGLPARLTPEQLRHIAGDFADGAALNQPVQAVPDAIRSAGSKMSNVMFNLSQAKDSPNAKLYGELYKEWDAAIRSVRPSPEGVPQ